MRASLFGGKWRGRNNGVKTGGIEISDRRNRRLTIGINRGIVIDGPREDGRRRSREKNRHLPINVSARRSKIGD